MPCRPDWRESFVIRLWAEPDHEALVLRGFIQNIQTGHKTYFKNLDLPIGLLQESAQRVAAPGEQVPLR